MCGHPAQWEPAGVGRTAKPGKAGMLAEPPVPSGATETGASRKHRQFTLGNFSNRWADLIRFWSPTLARFSDSGTCVYILKNWGNICIQ